jgi:hypothetical protein
MDSCSRLYQPIDWEERHTAKGVAMSVLDDLVANASYFPAPLQPQKDGSLAMEVVVAERKAFLSKRTLTYKCKFRVNDGTRSVTFWEMLMEKGSGVSGGDDMAPGFGFKKETYSTKAKEISGTIEEASRLFGKDFEFTWDYAVVRRMVSGAAAAAGYGFYVVLNPKAV